MTVINDREYRVIVPKYDNSGRKIRAEEMEGLAKKMSEHFGGVTIIPSVLGCWVSERDKKLICEENVVFSSLRDSESVPNWEKQKREDETFIKNLAREVGTRFGQESVLISEDKVEVDFIKGRYREELPRQRVGVDWFRKLI